MRNVKADQSNYSLSPQKKVIEPIIDHIFKAENDLKLLPLLFFTAKY